MSIKNRKIAITDDEVAFRINLKDAVEAFERITVKKITFSVAYDDNTLLIYPPRDNSGKQHDVKEIRDILDAD